MVWSVIIFVKTKKIVTLYYFSVVYCQGKKFVTSREPLLESSKLPFFSINKSVDFWLVYVWSVMWSVPINTTQGIRKWHNPCNNILIMYTFKLCNNYLYKITKFEQTL